MTALFDRLDTIILRVRHLDAALDWYRRVLGLAVVFEDPEDELAVLGLGHGTSITLYTLSAEEQPAPPTAAGPFPIFATQNAGAAYSILLERGARVDPIQEGGGCGSSPSMTRTATGWRRARSSTTIPGGPPGPDRPRASP